MCEQWSAACLILQSPNAGPTLTKGFGRSGLLLLLLPLRSLRRKKNTTSFKLGRGDPFVFYCYVTNDHEFSSLKQHT